MSSVEPSAGLRRSPRIRQDSSRSMRLRVQVLATAVCSHASMFCLFRFECFAHGSQVVISLAVDSDVSPVPPPRISFPRASIHHVSIPACESPPREVKTAGLGRFQESKTRQPWRIQRLFRTTVGNTILLANGVAVPKVPSFSHVWGRLRRAQGARQGLEVFSVMGYFPAGV